MKPLRVILNTKIGQKITQQVITYIGHYFSKFKLYLKLRRTDKWNNFLL